MTDRLPIRDFQTSGNVVALGEFAVGDTVPVTSGGTGATDAATARANLGITSNGEANTTSNSGAGAGLALPKSGVNLPFKSVVAGANINIVQNTDDITISAAASSGMTNPMNAIGDLVIGDTAGAPKRLGIGSTGYVLTVVSGSPAWASVAGSGTVTSVSVTSGNGFAGSVVGPTTTPAITISTTITGVLKGNGTAISAATSGTDYSAGTSALATGILKSTTSTGALSIATAGTDYVVPTGKVANLTGGSGGVVPYQSAADTTAFLANSAAGSFLRSGGGTAAPTWSVPTFPNAGGTAGKVLTSDGTNFVTSAYVLSAGGNVTFSGAFTFTGVINANTSVTFPASGNLGYLNIPQNSQSAAYTLVIGDEGKHIYHPSADTTARTWTIPANASVAFEVGAAVTFVNDTSGGVITIAITTDTLVLAGAGTTGSRTLAANGVATAIKVTSTRWIISGTGLT